MRHAIASLALLGLGVTWVSGASAQEAPYLQRYLPAPASGFELKIGSGYVQGFGNLRPGVTISSVAGAAIAFSADFDYRINPYVSAGEAQFQAFNAPNSDSANGLAFNLGATFHTRPDTHGDPWVRVGTGYRMLWDSSPSFQVGATTLYQGFDLVTAKIGYDLRDTQNVAFAPVVGANLQTFVWANGTAISGVQVGTFIYAGLQGRFDTGRSSRSVSASR